MKNEAVPAVRSPFIEILALEPAGQSEVSSCWLFKLTQRRSQSGGEERSRAARQLREIQTALSEPGYKTDKNWSYKTIKMSLYATSFVSI